MTDNYQLIYQILCQLFLADNEVDLLDKYIKLSDPYVDI